VRDFYFETAEFYNLAICEIFFCRQSSFKFESGLYKKKQFDKVFFKHQIFKGVIQMAQEFYVDGIGNISIQGPVVTLSYVRTTSQGNKPEDNKDEEVIKITMTGQNLVKMTNILGSTLKRIAERNKNAQNNQSDEMKNNKDKENNSKKSKTVN